MDSNTLMTVLMVAVLVVLVFFMFRNSRRRQRSQQEMQEQMVPGAEVMTNFGLFGTVVSIDTENNKVVLEIAPGTQATVHRQTIARVVESSGSPQGGAEDEAEESAGSAEPEFGERLEPGDDTKS